MNKVYLCIDLKTFYASVECVERNLDPFKTDLIVANLENTNKTICLAISPKMKARGIKNRCRVFEIPKNIHPIVAKPRMRKYIEYSSLIYSIYLKYVAKEDIYQYSIDEAFLDITSYLKMYQKNYIEIAKMIIDDIYKTTKISASVGIGTNMYLAKVALDIMAKHSKNSIAFLNEELYKKKLWHHLPITDFFRVGHGTEKRLHKLHLKDMYDIAHTDENILYKEFGINAKFLIDHAWGIEPCTIKDIKNYHPKTTSISNGQILSKDYNYINARIVLTEMVDNLVNQLVEKNLVAKGVGIYIGYSKNIIPSLKVSFKLEQATCSYKKILARVLTEYDYRINENVPIKRINVCFFGLVIQKYEQLDLFGKIKEEQKEKELEHTVVEIKNKFGKNSILRAISYQNEATAFKRNKLIGGHNAE